MNNWKVIFATAVIFGAGVITGGLLVNYVQHADVKTQRNKPAAAIASRLQATNPPVAAAADSAKPRPSEILSKQFLQQLDGELHLQVGQREAIQKIISEGQNQIRKAIHDARLEIREVLEPGQQKAFDDLIKRQFTKPNYGTNTTVAVPTKLSAPALDTNLSPEAQVLHMEAQRASLQAARLPSYLLPPPRILPLSNTP